MPHKPKYDADTLISRAKLLRADATPAERDLWHIVCGGKLGVRFRRQQPAGADAGLVVELDGIGHAARTDYDERRTRWLADKGLTVVRFANADGLERPDEVYVGTMTALRPLTPARKDAPPLTLKGRGEG